MPHFVTNFDAQDNPVARVSLLQTTLSPPSLPALSPHTITHTITHTHTAHSPQARSSAPAVAVSVLAGGRAGIVLARAYREHPLRDPAVSNESRYVLWILVRVVTYSAASHYADL